MAVLSLSDMSALAGYYSGPRWRTRKTMHKSTKSVPTITRLVFLSAGIGLVLGGFSALKVPLISHFFPRPHGLLQVPAQGLVPEDSLVSGSRDAPYKLVIFGDYHCPPCRAHWSRLSEKSRKSRGQISIYFRHFPLTTLHPFAADASLICLSAPPSAFKQVHQKLFEGAIPSSADELARQVDSLVPPGKRLLDSATGRLSRDIHLANSIGISGTPTMFLVLPNGQVAREPFDALLP